MATRRHSALKKPSPSQRSTKEAGPSCDFYDPKLEFDAPMYYNFGSQTPESERVDMWFEARLYQIQNHQFEEAKYSPITMQKHNMVQSKIFKTRTPSARKPKKATSGVPDLVDESIPKLSLDDATDDAPRISTYPTMVSKRSNTVVIKVAPTEVQVSQQPAVPVSALEKLAPLSMQPFVVAAPVPLSAPLAIQANDNQKDEKQVEASSFQSIQDVRTAPAEPPIRKRKLWEKPEMAVPKPRAWSPIKEVPASVVKPKPQERPATRLSLAAKSAASSSMASKTPVASRVLASRTPLEKPVAKKLTVPVAPRCLRANNTRSQTQPLTRSQTKKETQIKSSGRSLTRPKEFSFMARSGAMKKPKTDEFVPEKIKQLTVFPSLLRADSDPTPPQPKGLTRPVEFRFATTARAKTYATQHPAELDLGSQPSIPHKGLTQPKEFHFATSGRARATNPPSVPQVKPRQVSVSDAGKRLTVPQAFNLSKSNRPKTESVMPETRAKAKLAAKNEAVVRGPPRKRELTVAITPRVVTRKRKSLEKVVAEVVSFKARAAPQAAPLASIEPLSLTVPEPFDLLTDMRGAEKAEKFKHQIEKELQREQEARVFVARPLPSADAPAGVPEVEPAPLTVFEPFNLESESLSLIAKQRLEERIQYEQALEDEMRKFKANHPLTLRRAPFQPLTSNRPLTVPGTPDLKSSVRALDRADFSVEKRQRVAIKEQREIQEKALEEENEKDEVRKLRQTLVFKATPFVNSSPMRVAPSSKPLTVAESPQLRTNLRNMR